LERVRGFSLPEVVVALLVLAVGLLGVASTAGVAFRMVGQGQRDTQAAVLANHGLETLRSRPCESLKDSSAAYGRFAVRWTVTSIAGGSARAIVLTINSPSGKGVRTDTVTTTITC
jgi:type IV pilus modification protein PilV